ncbi:MAG: hypothetical protein AMXMBFR83_24750 [Phycisphaerae bacterium]|jgi:GAF domain-containing protein
MSWALDELAEAAASPADKPALYGRLRRVLFAGLEGERDFIANLANASAVLFQTLPDLNWAGFYLLKGRELVLGPFQGKPACVRIGLGRGVCGTAASRRVTLIVPDVSRFAGHIACDGDSKSEIVVPLLADGRLIGVMDLDSPRLNRFDDADAAGLEAIAELLLSASDYGPYR